MKLMVLISGQPFVTSLRKVEGLSLNQVLPCLLRNFDILTIVIGRYHLYVCEWDIDVKTDFTG
jgi:hypothetical protein